jgi:hypothetical protein
MTRTRQTEEPSIAVLPEAQAGVSGQALCRTHGISDAACYISLCETDHQSRSASGIGSFSSEYQHLDHFVIA